ncbi:sensor histidine kinase [Paractinoplanes ferrugineus]|uniref:sensor histidine kinase n=1 Tax=Paractinoplanes ferrugineus TaxID=113564 RepID=UPI003F690236
MLNRTTEALTALEASETRFRLSFDQSPLGMALTGLHGPESGTFLQANPALAAITGYPIDVLTGMNVRDLQHPDDVPGTVEALAALATGRVQQMTFDKRYRHADGHYIWVRLHTAVAHDDTAQPAYLVTQIEDIDAERAAAGQLAERAQLLDLTQDAVIVRSLNGEIRFWNTAAERIYGWPAQVAHGHDFDRLLDTTWTDGTTRAEVDAALREHGLWAGEVEHRRADGRRVVLLSRKALQRGADGQPIGVLSINTDITARRTAELALTASERRFRSQFEHSTVGQMIRALDDTIEDVNPAFAAMLGYTPAQLIGSPAARVFDPTRTDARQRALAAMFAGEKDSVSREGHLVKADGTLLDVHLNISAVRDVQGRPQRFVGIFQDITDRRTAENQRDTAMADLATKNSQLEEANQLKVDLIGMLGHEINNPLTAILGFSEQAMTGWDSLTGMAQQNIITVIDRNARRLSGVVREVLALVSLDAGKLTSYPQPTLLAPRVAAAMAATRETFPVDCTDRMSALVQPGHLDQILTNLLSNAAKYGGGATAVTVHPIGGQVQISVEDHGPGVPETFREHLFERFARSENTAGRVSGTGLGLYIVRELARANHGDITYRPHPDGGSIFTLLLPPTADLMVPASHAQSAAQSSPAEPPG